MRRKNLSIIILFALIVTACVPTVTPQPPTITPPVITVTAPIVPPTITPRPSYPPTPTPPPSPLQIPFSVTQSVTNTTLLNPDFEGGFTARENSVTVANGWGYWYLKHPPCSKLPCAGIPCPTNCGTCSTGDEGCYWAWPEFAAAYKPDYNPPRAHSGLWAQKAFVYGRQGQGGLYQQVRVTSRSVLTFSAWFEGWQCREGDLCSLQALKVGNPNKGFAPDPERALFLMGQWGCLPLDLEGDGYRRCKLWTASDRPYAMNMRIGIDPTGGTVPTATTVIWGPAIESFDYWSKAAITATTEGGVVTVFTSCAPRFDYARISNDCYLDLADLRVQPLEQWRVYLPMVRKADQ